MRSFSYSRASDARSAIQLAGAATTPRAPPTSAAAQYLAGGTNIVDFMKLGSWEAQALVDINDLEGEHGQIAVCAWARSPV